MKTLKFILIALLFTGFFSSCTKDDVPTVPVTGEPFGRATMLKFYFSSDTNSDLLNLNNNVLLPVSYENNFKIPNPPTSSNSLRYIYDGGDIQYDPNTNKYAWNTIIYGKKGYLTNKFYIRISETDTDTLDVNYKYSNGAIGGDGWYANIDKLYYNGTLILHESLDKNSVSTASHDKVFIKKIGKKTTISFTN
jgi:hypothetical protein